MVQTKFLLSALDGGWPPISLAPDLFTNRVIIFIHELVIGQLWNNNAWALILEVGVAIFQILGWGSWGLNEILLYPIM